MRNRTRQSGTMRRVAAVVGMATIILAAAGAQAQTELYTLEDLLKIGVEATHPVDGDYLLMNDIDATGEVIAPIAPASGDEITGVFDGQGHVIRNLTIQWNDARAALFGGMGTGGEIKNLGLENITVQANGWGAGALLGFVYDGVIRNCWSSGTVENAGQRTGGLVAALHGGQMYDCYSTANVICTGDQMFTGGLVGSLHNNNSVIERCYATGDVSSPGHYVGGLVGGTLDHGHVRDCYATGAATSPQSCVGGLVGRVNADATIERSYSTGVVSGGWDVGGLVGINENDAAVTDSFWDVDASLMGTSPSGVGKTTAEMQTDSTFTDAGWDFATVWFMQASGSYPLLAGPPEVKVPAGLVGAAEADAVAAVEAAQLVADVTYVFDDVVPAGEVMETTPPGDAVTNAGQTVQLVVSLGATTTMPSVVNPDTPMTLEDAIAAIEAAGLVAAVQYGYSDTVADGLVMGQIPEAGSEVAGGSTVTIIISQGPPPPMPVAWAPMLAAMALAGAGAAAMAGRRRRD